MWASRKATFQCAGGLQSAFSLRNGVANCLNTTQGRKSAYYADWVYSASFYGTQDTTWCPMQPECLNSFSYPWFPYVDSPDKGNWKSGTFIAPQPGFKMFRLPALPLSTRYCTPSPFVNSTANGNNNRTAYVSWATTAQVPTQCADDMTLSIVKLIGPGYYTTPLGKNARVDLRLADSTQFTNDLVVCEYTLGDSLPDGLLISNVTVAVTDGPVYASDDPLYTGNPGSPYWQVGYRSVPSRLAPTGIGSVSLYRVLNASVARSYTRVVDCVVNGVNTLTGLPFSLSAEQPYVVETFGQPWLPYTYPMPGNYTFSGPPTQAPTQAPTIAPTMVPTKVPTRAPTRRPTHNFFPFEEQEGQL